MPALLDAPTGTEENENLFSDLIPKPPGSPELIGGEFGAPAYQIDAGGKLSDVPRALPAESTTPNFFADLIPKTTAGQPRFGIFSDLVPVSPTAESEKALAETPKPPDPAWIAVEKGLENTTGIPFHQINNAARVLGQTAGRYIFDGMQAFERNRAQYYQNPTPEAYQVSGDQLLLPDGSRMSAEEEAAFEKRYQDEIASRAPEALGNAAALKQMSDATVGKIPVDPALADTVPARIAAAAGPVAVMTGESMIPGAGIPLMVMHGALATEQEALDAGATPEQAQRAAIRSAIGLGIFGGASKIAAAAVAKALPWLVKDPSQLTRFVTQFVGQEAANETSSRVISAWNAAADAPEGEKLQVAVGAATEMNLENTVMNTMFSLAHAARASRPKNVTALESGDPAVAAQLAEARQEAPVRPASAPTERPAVKRWPPRDPQPSAEVVQGNGPVNREAVPSSSQPEIATVSPERELLSRLTGEPLPRRGFTLPHAPLGAEDIIDIVHENGGVASRGTASKGQLQRSGDLWDDQPDLRGVYRRILGGKLMPDQMAAIAAEHGFGDGTVTSFWQEIGKATQARRDMRAQTVANAKAERTDRQQTRAFSREVLNPAGKERGESVNTSNLQIGDMLSIGDEKLKVTAIDPDTLDVTLEDGKRYGVQHVGDGQAIYVDKATLIPREQDHWPSPTLVQETSGSMGIGSLDRIPSPEEMLRQEAELGTDPATKAILAGKHWAAAEPDHGAINEVFGDRQSGLDYMNTMASRGEVLIEREPGKPDKVLKSIPHDDASLHAAKVARYTPPGSYLTAEPLKLALERGNAAEIRGKEDQKPARPEAAPQAATLPRESKGSYDTDLDRIAAESEGGRTREDMDLFSSATKTPEQIAAEKVAADSRLQKLQQAQDIRVGAARPLRAAELILGEKDMFTAEAQPELLGTVKAKLRDASAIIKDVVDESRKMGLVAPGSAGMQDGLQHLGKIWREIRELPKFGDFKKAILRFGGKMQSSFLEAREIQRTLKKSVPSRIAREGVFNYIEAGGDKATLTTWRDATPEADLKRGYQAALDLTPEQQAVAKHLADFYAKKLSQGQASGILAEGRENYVNRIVDKRRSKGFAPVTAGGSGVGTSGRLSKNFKHGLHRVYDNSFDAERNGIRYKTKDVAELAPIYLTEMNKVIGTRNLLADLVHGTAEDGRALAYPKGRLSTMNDAAGDMKARLIKPNAKQAVVDEMTGQDVSSYDYSSVDHPAMTGWTWAGKAGGKPIFIQGDLALHPEIAKHMKNLLGESSIRKWYNSDGSPLASIPKILARNLDKAQQVAKELLFSGSGFHHANIGFHAVEHHVNPLPEFFRSLSRDYTIDPRKPEVREAMAHGLQLAPDHVSASRFMEGFSGRAVQKVPLYGRIATAISDHLFERFIPSLKLRLYGSILERNMSRYAGELARNEVNPDQIKYLSATQANAALSHINYIDLGRSPTVQHILSLSTLAPDFSESRAKFLFQAGKTLLGSKAGLEQFRALAFGAGLIWTMARVLNKVADDDYHFEEPFSVVHNGRAYGIRSIQGDVAHLVTDPQKFTYGRVSPLVKLGLEQFITGTNYRGEKIGHIESLKEFLSNYVPISAKNLPGLRDLFETTKNNPVSPWESFLGALGVQVSRYSPISKTYRAAHEWKKATGISDDRGVFPVSKYIQLRYALEDGDFDRARERYEELVSDGGDPRKLDTGFRESVLHPFTGSVANDRKFRASLDQDGQAIFDAAIKRRQLILERYRHMRRSSPKE